MDACFSDSQTIQNMSTPTEKPKIAWLAVQLNHEIQSSWWGGAGVRALKKYRMPPPRENTKMYGHIAYSRSKGIRR